MPLYTFECPEGHIFESVVKYNTETKECPTCTQEAKRKIAGSGGQRFLFNYMAEDA